jgi:hypothetical protein
VVVVGEVGAVGTLVDADVVTPPPPETTLFPHAESNKTAAIESANRQFLYIFLEILSVADLDRRLVSES